MKTSAFVLFLFLLLQGCTPKVSPFLQPVQETNYNSAWKKLESYRINYGRSDDLHFFDENTGFVINSSGFLSFTEDGGKSWKVVHKSKGTFFRCITFKSRQEGWLGTIGTDDPHLASRDSIPLYETKDGGLTWSPVEFIGPTPKGLCGLQKVNEDVIVGCGRVRGPSYFIKTTDGGKTWHSQNLDHIAGSLIAAHFFDQSHGFLIGGTTRDKKNCQSMVLETLNGGITWDTVYLGNQIGEYPWKFSFPTKEKGFISIQRNVKDGRFYHLQTEDSGKTWKEVEHTNDYYYVQGIGFANPSIGFMGGSKGKTYETRDGGQTWKSYSDIGDGFNNFQFFEKGTAYGVGYGVFKCDNVLNTSIDKVEAFHYNGKLKGSYSIVDKKRNGPAKIYHHTGPLIAEGYYKDNLKVGQWKYYSLNGRLKEQFKMKNGIKKISDGKLKRFVGTYKDLDGMIRKITLENGVLFSQRDEGNKLAIFPETNARFFYAFDPEITIEFLKDGNDQYNHAVLYPKGMEKVLRKID